MLRWWRWRRAIRRQRAAELAPDLRWLTARVQYSALHPDGSRTVYPSEAAYAHDPVWNRRNGSITYGRAVDMDDNPLGPWRRVYAGDLRTHRGED